MSHAALLRSKQRLKDYELMINEDTRIEKSIDWLTATFGYEYNELMKTSKYDWSLPVGKGFNHAGIAKPTRYYKRGVELECGGTLEFSDNTEGVKPHAKLNLTGDNLRWLRQHTKFDDQTIINWALGTAQNVTRVDFAIDIFGSGDTRELLQAFKDGIVKTNSAVEHYEAIRGSRGHTVYFGSKKSELRMRVYDKAAEVGLLGEIWTRIEVQARKDYAMALTVDMVEHGVATGGTNRVNKMVDGKELDWWALAVDSEGKPSSGYKSGSTNWERWVKETVLPSLLDHAETDQKTVAMVLYALQERLLGQ
jgi:hypothetical protein